jgi:hypothetical protein
MLSQVTKLVNTWHDILPGTKRWLAELRTVSVIFLNLTAPFKENQLTELQTVIVEMQQTIYKYEGTVRQFMIEWDLFLVFAHSFPVTKAVCLLQVLDCRHSGMRTTR